MDDELKDALTDQGRPDALHVQQALLTFEVSLLLG